MMARPARGHRRSLVDISKPEANRVEANQVLSRELEKPKEDRWKVGNGSVRISVEDGPPLGFLSITVRVGSPPATTVDFSVHESLICARSPFFSNAMNGAWIEAESRIVPLPDDAPSTFAVYRTWLYTGMLACKTSSDSDEWELLACAYVLGEKLQDPDFKDVVIDAMIEKFNKHHPTLAKEKPAPFIIPSLNTASPSTDPVIDPQAAAAAEVEFFKRNPAVLVYIYENTPPKSPARRLLVDHYRAQGKRDWISADKRDFLPDDFLYALSFQFMAIKEDEEDNTPQSMRTSSLAPYQCEPSCAYHEHGKKMCYRWRQFPWVALKDASDATILKDANDAASRRGTPVCLDGF